MTEAFGKYQLHEKIAQGGMAEVFLASQQSEIGGFSKRVAIKRMFPHLLERDEIITMFIDEARIASSLNHPNIVQIYDLGVVDGTMFIAMEYVEGYDLRRLCEKAIALKRYFSREMAVRIIAEVASALDYAHSRTDLQGQPMNIVHRDVSPQNILVSVDGAVKICDFGIAKAESRLTDTLTGEFKGKFSYMSPEQFAGEELDRQSDVFTLGIVLYEITAWTRLFRGKNEYDTMRMVSEARVTPPSEFDPSFPRDLERIVLKSLERDRRLRYQSAGELQDALEEWLYHHRQRIGPLQLSQYVRSLGQEQGPAPQPPSAAATTAPMPTSSPSTAAPTTPIPTSSPGRTAKPIVDATVPMSLPESMFAQLDGHRTGASVRVESRVAPVDETLLDSLPEPPTNPLLKSLDDFEAEHTFILEQVVIDDKAETGERASLAPPVVETPAPRPAGPRPGPPGRLPSREGTPVPSRETLRDEDLSGTMRTPPRGHSEIEFDEALVKTRSETVVKIAIAVMAVLLFVAVVLMVRSPEEATEAGVAEENVEAVAEVPLSGPLAQHPMVDLRLETRPAGAKVVINGLLSEKSTPADFPFYEGVSNEVVFYLSEHRPVRMRIEATARESVPAIDLERVRSQSRARLYLRSEPAGAVVYLNGVKLGTTPMRLENIEADHEHHVQMELDGHYPFAGFAHLRSGGDNRLEGRLDPLTSPSRGSFVELDFQLQPRGTRIDIDGAIRGVSPFQDNQRRDQLLDLRFEGHERETMTRRLATSRVGTFLYQSALEAIPKEMGKVSMTVRPDAAIFIGSRAFSGSRLRDVELPEGRHIVVFETINGHRIRAQIEVQPNKNNRFEVVLRDGQAVVTTLD
jgi:serine/threonine protein kinase